MRHRPVLNMPNQYRGFTLMEAMMAVTILFAVVVSVTTAITAGQQHAMEAHERIAGTLAAEELLGRLIVSDYDDLPSWDGFTEAAGEMLDGNSDAFPDSFRMIGRQVSVSTTLEEFEDLDIRVRGRTIRVVATNRDGRIVSDLSRFVPEPQS